MEAIDRRKKDGLCFAIPFRMRSFRHERSRSSFPHRRRQQKDRNGNAQVSLHSRCAGASLTAALIAEDLKIALIHGRTGPLEVYAKQTETGLKLGLEYATKGTMETMAARSC